MTYYQPMKKISDEELIKSLAEKYGDHSAASRALGYSNPSAYRKARKNGLPSWRRDQALQLLNKDEEPTKQRHTATDCQAVCN